MIPRERLFLRPVIGQIEQGSIFSSAYSVDYPNKDVLGIIITPRCDIANDKVSTLHYLPIVRFADWLKVDLFQIVHSIVLKKFLGQLSARFTSNGLSVELIAIIDNEQLNKVLAARDVNPKERLAMTNLFNKYHATKNIQEAGIEGFLRDCQREVEQTLKEISEFKRRNFYLLEPWNEGDEVFVILLREIRSISRELAKELAGGCYLKDYPFKRYDDISNIETLTDDSFAYIQTVLSSPYMEHLIQTFFHNLGRIGIADYDPSIEQHLFSKV